MATNPRTKNTVEINCPYDVGDIYMTKSERKPWDRWPGTTWYQIQGVFMLGAENEGKYKNDTSGGEEYHTLTINEMPSHEHQLLFGQGAGSKGSSWARIDQNNPATPWANAQPTGGNWPHNNMPPYNTCYIYQRLT